MNVTAQAGDTLFPGGSVATAAANAKRALRASLRRRRHALPLIKRRYAARAAALKLFRSGLLRPCQRVAVYLSTGSEFDTGPLIEMLLSQRYQLFAPVLLRGGMRFRPLKDVPLHRHALGMLQPRYGLALRASQLDVVVLPLLGFDHQGTRLGQGGGHYDRALASGRGRPFRLGLAYAEQQVDALPRERWDQPLHAVLTERGLHRFHRHSGA